jgi:nitroreductase
MEKNKAIIDALTWRRAIKKFDVTKKVSDTDLKTILESANLSPSSYGLEPWKFIVVTNPEMRAKLRAVGYDQPKITDASHLIVVTQRTDGETLSTELLERTAASQNIKVEELSDFKKMIEGALSYKTVGTVRDSWFAKQTYIALGVMIETASLLGIDNGPMEGFDAAAVNEILELPAKNLFAVTMLTLGYRDTSEQLSPKVRREYADVVEFI